MEPHPVMLNDNEEAVSAIASFATLARRVAFRTLDFWPGIRLPPKKLLTNLRSALISLFHRALLLGGLPI
jgi:hypothetical protein